jgi:peptidoglycan/LPS O-acetylase OafA/YrhL
MNLIQKKYDFIDSLRGIAILLVLLTHSNYVFQPGSKLANTSLWGLISFGARGVQLFYIVSAFTLFNSYYIRQNKGQSNIFHFYLRRFFRIAPLFYLCMFLMILNTKYHFFENFQFFTPRVLSEIKYFQIENIKYWYLTTFTFTNGFSPKYIQSPYPGGWSIAVEFSFYILIPLLFKFIKNLNSSLWLTVITFLITTIITTTYVQTYFNYFMWSSLLNQFVFFSFGITAFFFFKDEKKYSRLNLLQFGIITLVALGAFIRTSLPLIGVIFFLFVIFSNNRTSIFNNRILQYIGKISFSIYLTQWWVIILLSKYTKINDSNWFIVFIFFVILNIALSSITYHLIEKKFIKYCEIFIKKIH